jgi:drug/metabolite transporter (DMT)-like permease
MGESFTSWQQSYLRIMLAAALAILIFRRVLTRKFLSSLSAKDWTVYGGRAILSYVVGIGMFTVAVQHAPLAVAAFASSLPIMGLLAWLIFRERMEALSVPFVALSVVGLALLTGISLADFHIGTGELAAIVAMLGFDLGFLMGRLHPKQATNLQSTALILVIGWIPVMVVSLLVGEALLPEHVTPAGWVALAISAVQNLAGLYLINYVFKHLKAYVVGNLLLLEGVFAVALGWLIYGEVPTAGVWAGAAIIIVCGYAISLIDARREQATGMAAPG